VSDCPLSRTACSKSADFVSLVFPRVKSFVQRDVSELFLQHIGIVRVRLPNCWIIRVLRPSCARTLIKTWTGCSTKCSNYSMALYIREVRKKRELISRLLWFSQQPLFENHTTNELKRLRLTEPLRHVACSLHGRW
jgi:hypothetical protein